MRDGGLLFEVTFWLHDHILSRQACNQLRGRHGFRAGNELARETQHTARLPVESRLHA